LLIRYPSFCQPCRAVTLAQIAAFHGHAVQPVGQAGELRALQLDNRHQFNARGLQPLLVHGEAAAIFGRCVGQLLELLERRWLAGADATLDLALGGRFAFGLMAGGEPLQPVIPLQLAHEGFLALVVLAVAGHAAVKADAVGQDVDVFVLGVDVPGDDELVLL
jgi:hypothetical protein